MTTKPLRLTHLHIPQRIPYASSLRLQSHILSQYYAWRVPLSGEQPDKKAAKPSIGLPALLTFNTHPTYTVGRRHLESDPLSQEQIDYLVAKDPHAQYAADFYASSRGGLLTYHGPGQLTAYPIIDLRQHGLGARVYVRMLEDVVIDTCKAVGVPNTAVSCTDPGVWMQDESGEVADRKICALGVQVTRGVSSHGIGLNVIDEPIESENEERYNFEDWKSVKTVDEFTKGYLSWGFGRIVACGLEGKSTTWLAKERANRSRIDRHGLSMGKVANVLATKLAESLGRIGKVEVEGVKGTTLGMLKHDDELRQAAEEYTRSE